MEPELGVALTVAVLEVENELRMTFRDDVEAIGLVVGTVVKENGATTEVWVAAPDNEPPDVEDPDDPVVLAGRPVALVEFTLPCSPGIPSGKHIDPRGSDTPHSFFDQEGFAVSSSSPSEASI